MSDHLSPIPRGVIIADRYEIEKYLGESLLGPTYVVKTVSNKKLLALKFIRKKYKTVEHEEEVRELMNRARLVVHDHVVRYGNVGTHDDMIYFTQEYFPSVNLLQLILEYSQEDKSFSIKEACLLVEKVLRALSSLHQQGIIHTNIKPENILIRNKVENDRLVREVKITDIMAASIIGEDNIKPSDYRAPECRPEYMLLSPTGPQADIYSVGNILYHLLVGRPATGTYLSPSHFREDLNSSIDTIVDTALSPTPEDRYETPEDMISAINLSFSDVFKDEEEATQTDDSKLLAIVGVLSVLAIFIGIIAMMADKTDPLKEAQEKDLKIRNQVSNMISQDKNPNEEKELQDKRTGMIYIPPGAMLTGNLHQEVQMGLVSAFDKKASIKKLSKGFYIDQYEYPNAETREDGTRVAPVTGYTYGQARAACKAMGKRLCTALEWEKACRGEDSLIYSYGDSFEQNTCALDEGYRLGKDKNCKGKNGVFGMSGGPREWTKTTSESNENRKVIKGGDLFGSSALDKYRCGFDSDENKEYVDANTSFRCCLSVDAPELPDIIPPELQIVEPSDEEDDIPEEIEAPTCSESIVEVMSQPHQFAIDCFDKKIKGGYSIQKMTGKVSFKVVLEEGKVASASKFTSEVKSGSFQECLLDGIKKLEFIDVCNEEATLSLTFPLDIEEDEESEGEE